MTLRQKLACVGLAVFGLQIASAAAGGAPLRDRLQRWFDPEQLLLASVRMELGAPPVAVSPTPEAAAALSAASPAPEVTPVPTADDDVENAPTATADGLPIVATSIAGGLTVKNETDIPVSVAALLQQGPATVLPAGEPQILIMHTHASEAFTPAGHDLYAASDTCRTEDTNYNIVHVGDVLADTLTNAGLEVLHDRTIYDYPSYTGSYSRSGAAVTHPDEPVVAAARLMRQRSIGALPVCEDDGTLAGMLTDRDIVVRCVSAGDDPQTATVRGIMSRDPVTIEADADVRTAMTAMRAAQVRRLPVTEGGKLAGVLSIDDIARSSKWDMECAQALCGITANVCRR